MFHGHRISAQGIEPMKVKVTSLLDMPAPRNINDVHAFIGLVYYYCQFVKNCSQIASPLLGVLKKNNIFKWTEEAQNAFETLHQTLAKAPILTHPDFTRPFILATEASIQGIGAVLSQIKSNGLEHLIAYAAVVLA